MVGRSAPAWCAGPNPGAASVERACGVGRRCACVGPRSTTCLFRGAFARYVVAPAEQLLALPDDLPARAAALHRADRGRHARGDPLGRDPADRVLVTGGGPVGLLVTAVLHARGIDDVTVSEPAPLRREHALQVGAARVVDAGRSPPAAHGSPVPEPFTVVFECSGNAAAGESAIEQLDFAGVCVLVGTGHDFPRLNHNRVIVLENTILGSYNYDADGFAAALELLASGAMPLDALVEPVDMFLDELLPVMQRCAAGELPGKVMVRPRRSGEVMSDDERFAPRLNHVAMTMPPESSSTTPVAPRSRAFYGDVFGWTEGDNSGESGQPAHHDDG